jgi:hypothetical protein
MRHERRGENKRGKKTKKRFTNMHKFLVVFEEWRYYLLVEQNVTTQNQRF